MARATGSWIVEALERPVDGIRAGSAFDHAACGRVGGRINLGDTRGRCRISWKSGPARSRKVPATGARSGYVTPPPVNIPIIVINGETEGKTAFVVAGINGIEILRRFEKSIDPAALKGVLLILPVVNVEGYSQRRREVPSDGKDLNRCSPGDPQGSVSDRIAHSVYQKVVL